MPAIFSWSKNGKWENGKVEKTLKCCPEGKRDKRALGQKVSSLNKRQRLIRTRHLWNISSIRHVVHEYGSSPETFDGSVRVCVCVCMPTHLSGQHTAHANILNRYCHHNHSNDYLHYKSLFVWAGAGPGVTMCAVNAAESRGHQLHLPAAQHINHWSLNQL